MFCFCGDYIIHQKGGLVLCQDLVQVKMSFSHSNLPAIPKFPVDTTFQNHRVTCNRNDYEAPSAIWTETAG